jgi:hypothetical protein
MWNTRAHGKYVESVSHCLVVSCWKFGLTPGFGWVTCAGNPGLPKVDVPPGNVC